MLDKKDKQDDDHKKIDETQEWICSIVKDIIKNLDHELLLEGSEQSHPCYHMPKGYGNNQVPGHYSQRSNQMYWYEPMKNSGCCSNCRKYYNYPLYNPQLYTCPVNHNCPDANAPQANTKVDNCTDPMRCNFCPHCNQCDAEDEEDDGYNKVCCCGKRKNYQTRYLSPYYTYTTNPERLEISGEKFGDKNDEMAEDESDFDTIENYSESSSTTSLYLNE